MLDRWGKEDEGILEESIDAIKNESEQMQIFMKAAFPRHIFRRKTYIVVSQV